MIPIFKNYYLKIKQKEITENSSKSNSSSKEGNIQHHQELFDEAYKKVKGLTTNTIQQSESSSSSDFSFQKDDNEDQSKSQKSENTTEAVNPVVLETLSEDSNEEDNDIF